MAIKKSKVKAGTSVKKATAPKAVASTKSSVSSKLTSAASAAKSITALAPGKTSTARATGRRGRHRHGALWYQREIMRLKLKKRYERVKFGGR